MNRNSTSVAESEDGAQRRKLGRPRVANEHGTPPRYSQGCRCQPCTEAHRVYRTALRRAAGILPKQPAQHGKASTYTQNKCRCAPCTEAQRLAVAEYRARRKAKDGF